VKYEAEIITEWEQTGTDNGVPTYAPLAMRLFQIDRWEDTTGTDASRLPSVPNALVIRCIVEKIELDKIRSDSKHHCLWCRPVAGVDPTAELPDDKIPQAEEDALHTFLATRGTMLSDRVLAVGPRTAGRTRHDVARRLKAWLRTLKKVA